MRLSVREDSPFQTPELLDVEKIIVNGEPRLDVIEACEEEGWAEVLVKGADGQFILNGDEFKTERISGNVQFVMRERA